MGFFKRLFGGSWEAQLEEAVFQDACDAFGRFSAEHGQEHITGFAACTVDDACAPYYMGATLESGFGPVGSLTDPGPEKSYGWQVGPADWCWSDGGRAGRAADVQYSVPEEGGIKANKVIFDAMCRGLKKFNDSGKFQGKLPRDQMVLMLWINDPSYPSWAVEYAAKLNPKPVAEWFKVANFYAGTDDEDEE